MVVYRIDREYQEVPFAAWGVFSSVGASSETGSTSKEAEDEK